MTNDVYALATAVSSHIADNPSDQRVLLDACVYGMQAAIHKAEEAAGRANVAMLSALCLADAKRMRQEEKNNFFRVIAKNIDGGSNIENRFRELGS